jgi:hypothetical protein
MLKLVPVCGMKVDDPPLIEPVVALTFHAWMRGNAPKRRWTVTNRSDCCPGADATSTSRTSVAGRTHVCRSVRLVTRRTVVTRHVLRTSWSVLDRATDANIVGLSRTSSIDFEDPAVRVLTAAPSVVGAPVAGTFQSRSSTDVPTVVAVTTLVADKAIASTSRPCRMLVVASEPVGAVALPASE